MKTEKETLKRLKKLEKRFYINPQTIEDKKRLEELTTLLQMEEYLRKHEEMTMTPQEILKADEERARQVTAWYIQLTRASPEEQKAMLQKQNQESAEQIKQFNAWSNSKQHTHPSPQNYSKLSNQPN